MAPQEPQGIGRLVGYVRVSTEEQSLDLQLDAMRAAGVEPDMIYTDTESGRSLASRDGLKLALKVCRKGDTLLVWKLDRMGRNTAELIVTVNRLNERGVNFRSLTQSEINTANQTTATGELIFQLFAMLAEFESNQLSERTRAGQAAAKARGRSFGRKTFAELYVENGRLSEYHRLRREDGLPIKAALREIKCPMPTYRKYKDMFEPSVIDDIGGRETPATR